MADYSQYCSCCNPRYRSDAPSSKYDVATTDATKRRIDLLTTRIKELKAERKSLRESLKKESSK